MSSQSPATTTNSDGNSSPASPLAPQHDTQKSLTIIALTGFAGSLVGLSISRSRTRTALSLGSKIHDGNAAANLPIVFAISTAAFASIIEYSYTLSPTRVLIGTLRGQGLLKDDNHELDKSLAVNQLCDEKCVMTIGDYAIGGALAGALFTGGSSGLAEKTISNALQAPKGDVKNTKANITFSSGTEKQKSMIGKGKVVTLANKKKGKKKGLGLKNRIPMMESSSNSTSTLGDRIPKHNSSAQKLGTRPLPRPKIMSGLTTGLFLGLFAGIAQVSLLKLEQYVEAQANVDAGADSITTEGENRTKNPAGKVWTQKEEDELDEKVKNMSTDEIQREIEALKKRL